MFLENSESDTVPPRQGNQIWHQEEAMQITKTNLEIWLFKHSHSPLTSLSPCETDIILDVSVTLMKGLLEICF